MRRVTVLLTIYVSVIFVNCERLGKVHTSAAHVLQLVQIETEIVETLAQYLHGEEERLNVIKSYVVGWNSTELESYVTNPLNSYHFFQRVTNNGGPILKALSNNQTSEVLREIQRLRSKADVPNASDVNGAAFALVKLQDIYNLTIDDLIEGFVSGSPAFKGLTVEDCLRFSQQAFHNLEFDLSDKWTEKALELLEKQQPMSQTTLSQIAEIETSSAKRKMMRGLVTNLARESEDVVAERFSGLGIPSSFQKSIHLKPEDNAQIVEVEKSYLSLCRGESIQVDDYYHGLFCSYSRGSSFYRLLMPFKVELVWPDPVMLIFHDVLDEKEMQTIMNLALPNLETTQVHSFFSHSPMKSLARIGKTAWVKPEDDVTVKGILSRVQEMTGLDTNSSEDFHILNYGVGGHYDVHVDFFDVYDKGLDPDQYMGDRLATILFYLNDVESGGATVFPDMELRVAPEKGSALFWFNLKRSGLGDFRTLHASCPVLLGQKWIANLWLHGYGQEFRWPCSLDSDE